MIGLVLAAGTGRRLRPYTDTLPKALVPIAPETTVLDLTLANYAEVGITEVAIVVGYAAAAIEARVEGFQDRYGVHLELVHNDKAETWNNAYSLWCARDLLSGGVMLANGDTVHPASVQRTLLDARGEGRQIILALDTEKSLADEEMKVIWTPTKGVEVITKLIDPAAATGEYIGVTLIEPAAGAALTAALKTTWERDPNLVLRGRLPGTCQPGQPDRRGPDRHSRLGGDRQPRRPGQGPRDRLPLLAGSRCWRNPR